MRRERDQISGIQLITHKVQDSVRGHREVALGQRVQPVDLCERTVGVAGHGVQGSAPCSVMGGHIFLLLEAAGEACYSSSEEREGGGGIGGVVTIRVSE